MRMASVYTPFEIKEYITVNEEFEPRYWRPARPLGLGFHFRRNFYVAWQVFLGRWDALCWESSIGYERTAAGLVPENPHAMRKQETP